MSQANGTRPGGVVVAIDGPSGSGKSTVSRQVAAAHGHAYLDTGAMYRAAAWWCLQRGVDLDDRPAVAHAVTQMPLAMGLDPASPTVHVGEADVTAAVRTPEITAVVSAVATNLAVRAELRARQQALIDVERASGRGIVAEGRDITTVVAPDADVRILLVATESARLARRALETHGADDDAALAATHDLVVRRDRDDSTVSAFTEAAEGVVTIDSSALTLEETNAAVLRVIDSALATAG